MRRAWSLSLVVVVACGHYVPIGSDDATGPTGLATTPDAGTATGPLDAAVLATVPASRCDPAGAFGDLTAIGLPALDGTVDTFRIASSAGGAGVLSLNGGNGDTLRSFQLVGDQITSLTSLGATYDRNPLLGQASLSQDGRTLVLAQTKDGSHSDLFLAHRDEIGQPFPDPKPMVHDGLTDPLFAPYLAGSRIYFSHVPKHGNETIMAGSFDPITGTISNAADVLPAGFLPSLDGARWIPVPTQDELELFFAHSNGSNDADILHARRASVNEAFGNPGSIAKPTGSQGFDYPTWVSDDGCSLWVVSRHDETSSLMRATRH